MERGLSRPFKMSRSWAGCDSHNLWKVGAVFGASLFLTDDQLADRISMRLYSRM